MAKKEDTTKAVTPAEEPKKTRKPREKVRSIEEIYDLPASKLTDKEKNALLKHLRENTVLLKNQVYQYKQNAEAGFEKARMTEEQYKAMETYFKKCLKEVGLQLKAFDASINNIIGGIE